MKVIFSKKDGSILSIVKINDNQIVSKQKCAKNNGLKEEDIVANYLNEEDLDIDINDDKVKVNKLKDLKFKKNKKLILETEQKDKVLKDVIS